MVVGVEAAPVGVRLAGLGVAVEGVAVLVGGVAVLVVGGGFGVWGFLVLAGAAVTAVGAALLLGRRGARSPAVVAQLLTLGVAFYATVPSARPEWGVPVAVLAAAVLAGLLAGPARAWAAE